MVRQLHEAIDEGRLRLRQVWELPRGLEKARSPEFSPDRHKGIADGYGFLGTGPPRASSGLAHVTPTTDQDRTQVGELAAVQEATRELCCDRASKILQMDAADLCTAICGWKRDNQRTISSRAKPEFPT
jgi:hypothetical protein